MIRQHRRCVWWVVGEHPAERVIGLEQRVDAKRVEVWLLALSGARRFSFEGTKLVAWGPPLAKQDMSFRTDAPVALRTWRGSDDAMPKGGEVARFLEGLYQGRGSPEELVEILRRTAADIEVLPPVSAHDASQALYEFPTGLSELLALNQSLG